MVSVLTYAGLFNDKISTTFEQNATFYNPPIAQENDKYTPTHDTWATDSIVLDSNVSLSNFPLGLQDNQNFHIHALGLGKSSTFLNTLTSQRIIPSKTWSLFWGLMGANPTTQMDGNLVFGGYDAAKLSGENLTRKFHRSNDCDTGLTVIVSDIIANPASRPSQSILGTPKARPLRMCIDPWYPIISIPEQVFNNFNDLVRESPLSLDSRSYGLNNGGIVSNASAA